MLKITKIKPMFTSLVVTADKYETDVKENGILTITAGTLKEYQTVVSVGPHVNGIEVGDKVMIDPKRFAVVNQKSKPKSLKDEFVDSSKITFAFDFVTINNTSHLLLQDRDILYVFEGEEIDDTTSNLILPVNKVIL